MECRTIGKKNPVLKVKFVNFLSKFCSSKLNADRIWYYQNSTGFNKAASQG